MGRRQARTIARRLRGLPSPALVIAGIALLVALAGSGMAATTLLIPANSVGTAQLRNSAVVSLKVRDHSLLAKDFAAGQLPAGPAGPAGATGPTGPAGPVGPGIQTWAIVKANGAVDRSAGVATVTRTGVGSYRVTFSSDVSACSLLAGAGTDTAGQTTRGAVADFNRTADPATVAVTTANGTAAADRAFTLAAICPPTTTTPTATTTTSTGATTTRTTTTTTP